MGNNSIFIVSRFYFNDSAQVFVLNIYIQSLRFQERKYEVHETKQSQIKG
ncbi:hypothetical protein PI172_1727 [Prevotella intermedia]|uniref:Uncharacterized protein n=1 Tax=Prevotella intermedia TaxID=28131 RepID=A0AAD1F7Q4_PREIN|nr:hypothetical protein PI172_1727 [Prevotella intermedia]